MFSFMVNIAIDAIEDSSSEEKRSRHAQVLPSLGAIA